MLSTFRDENRMKEKHCLSKRSRSSGGVIKIIANFKCCLPQTTSLDFFLLCMLFCVTSLSVSGVKTCFDRLEAGICSCFMEQWGTCTDLGGSGAGAHSADMRRVLVLAVLTSGRHTPSLLLLCTSLLPVLADKELRTSWQSLWWLM